MTTKTDYLLAYIVKEINKAKVLKVAKQNRIEYYTTNKNKLESFCLTKLKDFDFIAEVKRTNEKFKELKKVERLERHMYAPELNKLWYKDGTFKNVPGILTIEKAVGL